MVRLSILLQKHVGDLFKSMPDYGVLPSDRWEYHVLDSNGRMKCNDAKPQDMETGGKEMVFGKEICPDCKAQLTDEEIVDSILDDVDT